MGLKLEGSSTCPSAAELRRALEAVGDPVDGQGSQATVESVPGGLRVALQKVDGSSQERVLPLGDSCEALARAAAVTLAIWDAHFAPGGGALRPVIPFGVAPSTTAGNPLPIDVTLGAGVDASVARSSTVGGQVFAWLAPEESSAAAVVAVLVDGPRSSGLSSGQVTWERQALGAGGAWRPAWRTWTLALEADALAGALQVRGADFAVDRVHTGFELGVDGSARVGWTRYRLAPWVGVQVTGWLLGQEAYADGTARTVSLSPLEGWAGGGVLYHFE